MRGRLPSVRSEQGLALPMALGVVMVLAIVSVTLISISSTGETSTRHVSNDRLAFSLAEAGMNDGVAALYSASDPLSATAVAAGSTSMNGGTASYSATLSGTTWTLTGTGTVPSSTHGAGDVVRTVSMQVTVGLTPNSPWYFTFADSSSACMDLKKDAVIATPLYVKGNLCLGKDAVITGSPLEVDGTLTLGNGATVGTPGSPIAEARLLGGCTGGSPNPHPCTAADGVYVTNLNTTPIGLSKPAVDLPHWYANAKPGPANSCTLGSVPGNFDNDGNGPNNSRGAFNLMPAAAYDCRVTDLSGNIIGRLSWTPGSPGTLIVAGTILFDGSVSVADNAYGVYQGRATIYSSGTVHLGMNSSLCGIAACDTGWNWNQNLLMLVAGSSAGGETFTLEKNVTFQGQAYAVGDFSAKKDANIWGPVIADELDFAKDAGLGTFPSTLPPGAPGADGAVTRVAGTWRG